VAPGQLDEFARAWPSERIDAIAKDRRPPLVVLIAPKLMVAGAGVQS
jgi:hypothetical protein